MAYLACSSASLLPTYNTLKWVDLGGISFSSPDQSRALCLVTLEVPVGFFPCPMTSN